MTHPPAGTSTHVVDLTDEEILGIDGPRSDQVAPLPWAGRHTPEETELAAEVGLRSLVTRGALDADEDGVRLPAELGDALDLRHGAQTIVYADHSTPTTQETRVLYIHPEAVLTESVNAAGVHRFRVGQLAGALADLGPWSEPQQHPGDDGHLDGDDLPAELAGLQSVVCLDVVTLRSDDDVDTCSLTFYRLADDSVVEGIETSSTLDLLPRNREQIHQRVIETVCGGMPRLT